MRILTLALLALTPWPQSAPPGRTLGETDMNRFLYLSILEGLMEDGADKDLIQKAVAEGESLFVLKCPICAPVHSAFSAYQQTPRYGTPRFPTEIAQGLKADDLKTRRAALQKLVDRYISAGFARRAMPDGEKAQMRKLLEEGKKSGMGFAQITKFGETCPSCEGANRKP